MIPPLWAPAAKSVELLLGDRRIALERSGDGDWTTTLAVPAGEEYRYSIDGGPAFPDPRSRWQPDGVHGGSRVVDAAELKRLQEIGFRAPPLREAVIYELHVGTFTPEGTYNAARERLDHLAQLGVTHVELMPLATFPGDYGWGYDGVYLYAPLPAYGTPHDLARFVSDCHRHGLAVLLDVVYNHLGPDGNYLELAGPYFTDRVKTPWGTAINYDGPHSDGVRRFVIDNALMWLEDYGFDGLRLDAVHAIFSFEAVHVLEELADAVSELGRKLNRDLVLIAESDLNDPRLVHAASRGGYGLAAHWCDDFHHALHRHVTDETTGYYADFHGLEDLATALRDGYVYQGRYSAYRQRRHGRPPSRVSPDQLVVCAQNHDQIGNRAQGERLSMLLNVPQLKAVAALVLLSRFVPLLFQGEEWGAQTPFLYFTDHQDAELGRLVTEGRSREFKAFAWTVEVPDPQSRDTFERSKLDWPELQQADRAELFAWYRRLIRLRRGKFRDSEAAAADGGTSGPGGEGLDAATAAARLEVKFDADARWLWFTHGGVLAVFNFAAQAQSVPSPPGEWILVMSATGRDGEAAAAPHRGAGTGAGAEVPAHDTRIFARRLPG